MASVENVPAYMLPGVPVVQPPNLEGDPSLATEILPGPPPLSSIQHSGLPRKDHKKVSTPVSYLPMSDPGTTYMGHMAAPLTAPTAEVEGPRRKRARLDKGSAAGRAQRATARSMNGAAPSSEPGQEILASSSRLVSDSEGLALPPDSDPPTLSRSNSVLVADVEDGSPPLSDTRKTQGSRREKGKGRAKDTAVRVKEEPSVVTLPANELAPANRLLNEDHCSSCRSLGSLVYCDGCPRAFHLWCLNPPMEAADLPEGDDRWYCPACEAQEKLPSKFPPSLKFITPLLHQLESSIPVEFQLPQDIKGYFKDIGASPWGTYVDTSEVRLRINRHGQIEEREPYRLKDRNGDPVLCFRCGTSALPLGMAAARAVKRARKDTIDTPATESGRAIISCDYCHLHWHLDCVDPPLAALPAWNKKWMCPNHADQIFQPKRRIPRANATPIEITKPRQHNNGNIEVIDPEASEAPPPKMLVDEVLINGRRYRVPERIIRLEFWEKIGKPLAMPRSPDDTSRMSSPLTSLSSLAEEDAILPSMLPPSLYTLQDVQVAQLLSGLRLHSPAPPEGSPPGSNDAHIRELKTHGPMQTEDEPPTQANGVSKRPKRAAAARGSLRTTAAARLQAEADGSQSSRSPALLGEEEDFRMEAEPIPSASGRSRRTGPRKPAVSRTASRGAGTSASAAVRTNGTAGADQNGSAVKQEPVAPDLASLSSVSARPSKARQPRKRKSSGPANGGRTSPGEDALGVSGTATAAHPALAGTLSNAKTSARRKHPAPKPPAREATPPPRGPVVSSSAAAGPSGAKPSDATPTLKIRLPRLNSITKAPLPAPSTTTSVDETEIVLPRSRVPARSASRRGSRRQTSASTSMNGMSISSEAS